MKFLQGVWREDVASFSPLLFLFLHLQLHNYQAALTDAEAALSENSRDINSYILAGQATAAMGKFKEAFHHYKAGLQIDPNSKVRSLLK